MKEYPLRPKELTILDICECGHQKHKHLDFTLPPEKKTNFGKCSKCLCPEYKFEQKLPIEESWKLEQQIAKNAEKAGFTT